MPKEPTRFYQTKGGALVVTDGSVVPVTDRRGRPAFKVQTYYVTGGRFGLLWLDQLRPLNDREVVRLQKEINNARAAE